MDTWFNFILDQNSSESDALEELKGCNLEHPSFTEDMETGIRSLYAQVDSSLLPSNFKHISSFTKIVDTEINWSCEWNQFSPYFLDGKAHIPLSDFDGSSEENLTLLPGPGFGDLSHPTTTLSLTLLAKHSSKKILIDLGCGSGILSLAALKWGALFAYGLDIDPGALLHTEENARLNQLHEKISTSKKLPPSFNSEDSLLVINMIFAEQKIALADLNFFPDLWISSGILKEQEDIYLSWVKEKGFYLETSLTKEGWSAFVFRTGQSTATVM